LTRLGHEVRLMPPQYLKPYVKTNKHDAADAEGCCEAAQRPSMRFVPVKSETQQSLLMLHRIRYRPGDRHGDGGEHRRSSAIQERPRARSLDRARIEAAIERRQDQAGPVLARAPIAYLRNLLMVAQANKTARIAWPVLARREPFAVAA
jgi:transposase